MFLLKQGHSNEVLLWHPQIPWYTNTFPQKVLQTLQTYAPVKVNPDRPSPTPGYVALVGLCHHTLSPQYAGDSHVLSLLSWGMLGINRGFVLIQDGGNHSHKDFRVYFGTWERTQVFTIICGICLIVIQINSSINLGHGFKKAKALILRCR